MGWLDSIEIGHDLQICPDCNREYEVLEQFLGETQDRLTDWIDAVFNHTYYIELRCPQCLETRYLCIQALTPTQFYTEKEKENKK
ncbi:MAG: hypothetical protein OXM61_16410 [Candidatus Poribacteria bacterium]|nr:hypothetical protein [Candidatus Poribacteria bacterium]